MRSPSKTICFCRIWGDFIIVIHGVTFESQSPQTRMITDFFLVLSVLNEQHFFNKVIACSQQFRSVHFYLSSGAFCRRLDIYVGTRSFCGVKILSTLTIRISCETSPTALTNIGSIFLRFLPNVLSIVRPKYFSILTRVSRTRLHAFQHKSGSKLWSPIISAIVA